MTGIESAGYFSNEVTEREDFDTQNDISTEKQVKREDDTHKEICLDSEMEKDIEIQSRPLLASEEDIRKDKYKNEVVLRNRIYGERLRRFEGTYQARQENLPTSDYNFRIRLIWDHNLLWGTFELQSIRGLLVVDPGPDQDPLQPVGDYYSEHTDDDHDEHDDQHRDDAKTRETDEHRDPKSREYNLFWREAFRKKPKTRSEHRFEVGTICFGDIDLRVCFKGMVDVEDYCIFHGRRVLGPADVPPFWKIQDFIGEWNKWGAFYKHGPKVLRFGIGSSEQPEDEDLKYPTIFAKLDDKDRQRRMEFFLSITGIFDISPPSKEIRIQKIYGQQWTIRFHVDEKTTEIWGHFTVGKLVGYLFTKISLRQDEYLLENVVEFKWCGKKGEKSLKGAGIVFFNQDRIIVGMFRDMDGEDYVPFEGQRKMMPEGSSGRSIISYRKGWDDYRHGNSVHIS